MEFVSIILTIKNVCERMFTSVVAQLVGSDGLSKKLIAKFKDE